jgi:hypothetical protein
VLDGQQSAVDGGDQRRVIVFGLVRVAPGECAQCRLHSTRAAHVTGDHVQSFGFTVHLSNIDGIGFRTS